MAVDAGFLGRFPAPEHVEIMHVSVYKLQCKRREIRTWSGA